MNGRIKACLILRGDIMKISIIVPIFKVEKFIHQCIESITAQTYRDIEIILVDDGSPDNCPSICDEYALKDSRINVVHQENKGLIEARKSGLRAATGDYVCFVDGDDWIEPDMYENIARAIEKYNPDCVVTQFYYSYPDREEKSRYCFNKEYYSRSELEKEVFPIMLFDGTYYSFGVYPNCWTKVFKKEILEKHIYDVDSRIRLGEDIAFTYPCLMSSNSVSFIDEPLYYYRVNNESMTKTYDSQLSELFMLPYLSLVNKSRELNIDLRLQLPYYLLYLTNFVVRNEAININSKSIDARDSILNTIMHNEIVSAELSNIKTSLLPLHTKILVYILKSKRVLLLKWYIALLRRTIN